MSADTKPVRDAENLDWERLATYLRNELAVSGSMSVRQFASGHSNLTYELQFGDAAYVLRRPPFGPLPPRAHDMAREYRILAAVHPRFPLAPQPLLLCEDTSVIGSIFYVMERRRGIVIRDEEPDGIEPLRTRISGNVVDTLAALHAIDASDPDVAIIGKPGGFVERQIRGWSERWQASKTSEVADMTWLARWLEERIPADASRPSIVHGDFKLDNIMLDERDPSRVAGVFDWEMAAIGDPRIDVGIFLCYWVHAARDVIPGVTTRPGWFTREEILERYGAPADILLYEVFAVFKLAVVIQQIYSRYVRGQTDDPRFAPLGGAVARLAAIAKRLAVR